MSDRPPSRPSVTEMPVPTQEAQAHSLQLVEMIRDEMSHQDGRLGFDRFMELALYAPGLGYYTAGARKLGEEGDFVTAPEVSDLFGRCLARQCVDLLQELGGGELLEFGAGSGAMARDLLLELEQLGSLPERYLILELSPDLKQRQQETLEACAPHLLERVEWLERMPGPGFRGVVIANEVLDAMPVHRFRIGEEGLQEGFVRWAEERFEFFWGPAATPGLEQAVEALQKRVGPLQEDYESEINLRSGPWLEVLAEVMQAGALLLIDYGYPASEFYHPQRNRGTLMCYYRHRAHQDVLALPGLQDITAHVDFSSVARAACEAGFELAGYTSQAHFLLGCGLDQLVADSDPHDIKVHMARMQEVKRLTLPAEMGERFKVLALSKELNKPLRGFALRDLGNKL